MADSFQSLLAQLQSPEVARRSQAVLALRPGTVPDDEAVAALVGILCADPDLNVIEDATWVLVRYGPLATAALLGHIQHDQPRVRHNIVHALGKIADRRALPELILSSQDTDAGVRLKSVVALGQLREPEAIDALVTRLQDEIQDVQWTAREVLEAFGQQAVPALIRALEQESAPLRELAASLLGEAADARAVEPLLAAFHTEDGPVRLAVIEALGQIGDSRARPLIQQALEDPHPHVRAMARAVATRMDGRRG